MKRKWRDTSLSRKPKPEAEEADPEADESSDEPEVDHEMLYDR